MKTTDENRETFEEIVFSDRNKEYGAYLIRREYPKALSRGLMISVTALLVGIGIPLIAGLYNQANVRPPDITVIGELGNPDDLKKEEIELPKLPEDTKALEEETRFEPPVVTDDSTKISGFDFDMEAINSRRPPQFTGDDTISNEKPEIPKVIETPETPKIYTVVGEMPEFPGGEGARLKFLHDNIVYPKDAREIGIGGTVYLSFVVDENGHIININILRGIGGGCENEAVRVTAMMPTWKPGRMSGIPVKVQFNMPVKFELN